MKKLIRIPRNNSATMQALQRLMASGHIYWCAGTVPKNRLHAFILKTAVGAYEFGQIQGRIRAS